ncbi:MAG: purine nucleosidase [Crocinitomix sp.]|jgi:purine nucleosidase
MSKQPLIILQDGAVDELISVALVGTMQNVELLGIVVVNADCRAAPTVDVTQKVLNLMQQPNVPITTSIARAVNAFPWSYRQYSMMANLLPMLNITPNTVPPSTESGEQMIVDLIQNNMQQGGEKVKVLVLSPMTPLTTALSMDPNIKNGIAEIIWMGGALEPANGNCGFPYGNVDPGLAPGANANAEWNAYWDPFSVQEILASGIPLTMFPLNATNEVMLTPEIVLKFAPDSAQYPLYALSGQMYAMVAFEAGYAFWDTVTTAYLDQPSLYTIEQQLLLNVTEGDNEGNIVQSPNGYEVNVVTDIDVNGFYAYLFEQLTWVG